LKIQVFGYVLLLPFCYVTLHRNADTYRRFERPRPIHLQGPVVLRVLRNVGYYLPVDTA